MTEEVSQYTPEARAARALRAHVIAEHPDIEPNQPGWDMVRKHQAATSQGIDSATVSTRHVGKYREFSAWLSRQTKDRVNVTFAAVEEILGFPLPASARRHNAYWSGGQAGSTIGNAIRDAGWRAVNVNMAGERVTMERVR